jgi:prepilin-type N-terminal cleavage/methylation domain-containing protein
MVKQWRTKLTGQRTEPATGFSLMEVMTAIAVLGVLTALGAPLLFGFNKPLQNATAQMEGVFKQARMRAISTTSAYRVRLISPTQVTVEAASTRGCEATTQLTAIANASDTQITVTSTRGFAIGDRINVGSLTNLDVTSIDEGLRQIGLGAPISSSQPMDALIELTNNWRQGALITGITEEDLTLPKARNHQEQIRLTTTTTGLPTNWNLCFNSRGIANLFDTSTGRPIPGSLTLNVFRANANGTQVAGAPTGQVTILQGGGVVSNARSINE